MKINKQSIVLPALVALIVSSVALPVAAIENTDTTTNDDTTTTSTDDTSRQQNITDRKAAIKQRLETMRQERKQKLDARRLQVCEKRQQRINTIFTHGTAQGQKHLAVFQKIEQKVEDFYTKNNLKADGYDAAVAAVDEKEAAAVATLEASSTVTFDCATTDGAHPGKVVKEAVKLRHVALKEYRTAIKDLILVVKKANGEEKKATVHTPAPDAVVEEEN